MKRFYEYKIVKIFVKLTIIFLLILLIIFLFLKLWIPFGGLPNDENKKEYASRANNYKDGKFYNINDFQMIYKDYNENKFVSKKGTIPIDKIPTELPMILENPSIDILNITWLGHSTILMQMHGMNILIDPVFSEKTSPVSFLGPSRFSDLVINAESLPHIDVVLITHDHYDHLDYKTIKNIDEKVDKYVVPLGVENHLERWKVDKDKIINLAWWEEVKINGLLIGCTPARHYSGRSLNDRYNTLWASWIFIDEYYKVFDSGDTGFDNHFEEIYKKYGSFDLSMLDSGQYDVRWKSTHMTPEEAVEAGRVLDSKIIMPIHFGAYKLANHPWDDSLERFSINLENQHLQYITPKIGETITYDINVETEKWWIDIN